MESADEIESESIVVLPDGCWLYVGSAMLQLTCRYSPENLYGSTGACCIGRTVLNFQAMPKDKTCKCQIYLRGQTEIADEYSSWRCHPLDVESVSAASSFYYDSTQLRIASKSTLA